MAKGDTGRTGIPAAAVLAVALSLLPAAAAAASCSAGNRVGRRDAECLSAWWKNRMAPARAACSDGLGLGRLRAPEVDTSQVPQASTARRSAGRARRPGCVATTRP